MAKRKKDKRTNNDLKTNFRGFSGSIYHLIPGLKIIPTFDWLKPRKLKTHIPGVARP
jgi:hypothetical protein